MQADGVDVNDPGKLKDVFLDTTRPLESKKQKASRNYRSFNLFGSMTEVRTYPSCFEDFRTYLVGGGTRETLARPTVKTNVEG